MPDFSFHECERGATPRKADHEVIANFPNLNVVTDANAFWIELAQ
jgi:hypothetical protein